MLHSFSKKVLPLPLRLRRSFLIPSVLCSSVLLTVVSCSNQPTTQEPGTVSSPVASVADNSNANGMKTITGETRPLGKGEVTSFVTMDAESKPVSLGLRFTKEALEGLPQNCSKEKPPETSFWLFCFGGKMNDTLVTIFDVPKEAVAMTNVKNMELSWLPYGHAPEKIWDKPQFDIHFNYVTPTGGKDMSKVYVETEPGELPEGYKILPGSGFPWDTPAQQSHSHSAAPASSPEFQGKPFTTNFLYTTYNGDVVGYEPYVEFNYMKSLKELKEIPIQKPEIYPKDGYYPSIMKVGLDQATGNYIIALEGYEFHKAREKGTAK